MANVKNERIINFKVSFFNDICKSKRTKPKLIETLNIYFHIRLCSIDFLKSDSRQLAHRLCRSKCMIFKFK